MSSSLVKRSLSLFDDDLKQDKPATKKKKKVNPMTAIGTQKKGVTKKLLKLKSQNQKKKNVEKYRKSAIETYQEQQKQDYTEQSLRNLQRISILSSTEAKTSKVILDHHLKSKRARRGTEGEKQKEGRSIFSEADFDKFSKEYDFSKQ